MLNNERGTSWQTLCKASEMEQAGPPAGILPCKAHVQWIRRLFVAGIHKFLCLSPCQPTNCSSQPEKGHFLGFNLPVSQCMSDR